MSVRRLRHRQRANIRHRLAERDGGAICVYCGQRRRLRKLTIDHVMPRSRGGTNDLANLVLACRACNGAKGDTILEEAA